MNKIILNITSVLLLITTFFGCNQKSDIETLKVDILNIHEVSFFDIFSKCEIIPLETNEQSLIKDITKVLFFEDMFYILDYQKGELLLFNSKGDYMTKISQKGEGPNQYLNISDFDIDSINRVITILAPVNRSIFEFELDGSFKAKYELPVIKGAYNRIKCLNSDTLVFWTFDDDNRIKFYSKSDNTIFNEVYPEKNNILNNFTPFVFPYSNYFCRSSDNIIYEITDDSSIYEKYKWDFMKLNNSKKNINKFETIPSNELHKYTDDILNSEGINYILFLHGGTSKFYYTQLWRKNKRINVFYDRDNNNQHVFVKTSEDAKFYPLFWKDNYAIGFYSEILGDIDETIPEEILDTNTLQIKRGLNEYDNPILIKYYFK